MPRTLTPYVIWLTETQCLEYRVFARSEEEALERLEDLPLAADRTKVLDRTIEIREEKNELETSV